MERSNSEYVIILLYYTYYFYVIVLTCHLHRYKWRGFQGTL